MRGNFKNKSILITGACGSVGSELVNQLITKKYEIAELTAIDNNESSFFSGTKVFARSQIKVLSQILSIKMF